MRYVALLRGINVGGNTMIKMEEIRAMLEALRFYNVTSYINSGNLAFDVRDGQSIGKDVESDLIAEIESAIEKSFRKNVFVMVREQSHIGSVIAKTLSPVNLNATKKCTFFLSRTKCRLKSKNNY
ncbi:hypothetical protein BH24ACI3_BH24ACI3_03400 [soil metagenome]